MLMEVISHVRGKADALHTQVISLTPEAVVLDRVARNGEGRAGGSYESPISHKGATFTNFDRKPKQESYRSTRRSAHHMLVSRSDRSFLDPEWHELT
jgi:hypothetical protein